MAEDPSKKNEAYRIAEADSKNCEICRGDGMATVYAPSYGCGDKPASALRRDNLGRPCVVRTVAHCLCPLGRYLRATTKEDVLRRMPDVVNINEGYSQWSLIDPTEEPIDDPGRPVTKADFDAFRRKLENRPVLKDVDHVAPARQTPWSILTAYRRRIARELELDEAVAEVLTIHELMKIKESRGGKV